jgi:hypothetical protein
MLIILFFKLAAYFELKASSSGQQYKIQNIKKNHFMYFILLA